MNQRILWGVLGAVLLLFLVAFGGIYYTLALGLLVTLGILEYGEMLKQQGLRPHSKLMIGVSLLLLAVIHVVQSHTGLDPWESLYLSERMIGLMLVAMFCGSWLIVIGKGNPEKGFENVAANLFGAVYIGFLFAYILLLRYIPGRNSFFVLFTILVTWGNDSFAYFVGINCGKHKLSPLISPKKSIEGAIGGLFGGLLVALVMGLVGSYPLGVSLCLGALTVIAGQFGDLLESVIKRNAGIKDSGSFLPGHGGVLDRFDSLMVAAPIVYYMAVYVLPH